MRVVGVLEQVVGLKDVMGLHPVLGDGLDEVADVFQLEGNRWWSVRGGIRWRAEGVRAQG